MSFEVIATKRFEKDAEYYYKKKKYTRIYEDINDIVTIIENGTLVGSVIDNIGNTTDIRTYKVRSVNSSIKLGASNGFRIIYVVEVPNDTVYLLTIYSKKDSNNIPTNSEIAALVKALLATIK